MATGLLNSLWRCAPALVLAGALVCAQLVAARADDSASAAAAADQSDAPVTASAGALSLSLAHASAARVSATAGGVLPLFALADLALANDAAPVLFPDQNAVQDDATPESGDEPQTETIAPGAGPEITTESLGDAAGEAPDKHADAGPCLTPCDDCELWLVSTRHLAGACGDCSPLFEPCVKRYLCGSGWTSATLAEFLDGDDGTRPTTIFVHGNDSDANYVASMGRDLYRQLCSSRCPGPATRLVIWSWPSDRVVCGVRNDSRIKACRTNVEGYFLARFVDQLSGQTPLALGGYSYGARVVTGGLHILGGGVLEGRQLAERQRAAEQPANAILMGAAMASDWLLPGRRHDQAMSQVDRMVVLVNSRDRVLRWYPYLWGRGGPSALGSDGVAAPSRLGPERAKLVQISVESELRRKHSWRYYSGSPRIMAIVRREILLIPAGKVGAGTDAPQTVEAQPVEAHVVEADTVEAQNIEAQQAVERF